MTDDRDLDIEKPSDDTPEGAPSPGAKAKNKSLLEGAGIPDGVGGTAGENKVQDR